MKVRKRRNTIYSSLGCSLMFILAGVLVLLIGISNWLLNDLFWLFSITALIAIVCVYGAFSNFASKIVLRESEITVFELGKQRSIDKGKISKVRWEKGGGVFLTLQDGSHISIPDQGNSQSVCNIIRAWLKRDAQQGTAPDG